MPFTYHGSLELVDYEDGRFKGVQLIVNFLSGQTEYVCLYIGDRTPLTKFLNDKINGSKIRLDGFADIHPTEGFDIDGDDKIDELFSNEKFDEVNRILEEDNQKASMILRWKNGTLYATSICNTEEHDNDIYKINETNIFDAIGIEMITDEVLEIDI
jgi:hypothetical protein